MAMREDEPDKVVKDAIEAGRPGPVTAVFCLTCSVCHTSTQTRVVPVDISMNLTKIYYISDKEKDMCPGWKVGRTIDLDTLKIKFEVFCPKCWEKEKHRFPKIK